MADIEHARKLINEVDAEMRTLFARRMDAVREVAEYKKERGLQITDIEREKEVLRRGAEKMEVPEYVSYYTSFLQYTMDISKQYQHRLLDGMRVAYSGVEGAFANIAARRAFPDATAIAYADFRSAYEAVENGECDCVILPVENSFNGDVGQVMDLAFFGTLYINDIFDVEVVQNLLVVPGAKMEDIQTVISHSQALGQCAGFIHRHKLKTESSVNTAVAAKQVAEMGRKDIAAIGSAEAAQTYGLTKLKTHINEKSGNTTRFAVFSRTPKESAGDKRFVMTFTVSNEAGSLGKAVNVIGQHGFNLRALKSRPTKELSWSYYFYAEGDGNIKSPEGKKMLEELAKCCNTLRVLGSFEKETTLEEPK